MEQYPLFYIDCLFCIVLVVLLLPARTKSSHIGLQAHSPELESRKLPYYPL